MSRPRKSQRGLRIGLFGGTFDPIHNGHVAVARAARRRFRLDHIYFIPCGRPPHKDRPELSPYLHRLTMVALACAGQAAFRPSLLEAGPDLRGLRRYYSIQTVRRLRSLVGPRARLYFLLGADAFLYLPTWKNFQQLVRLCEFIVAARPGFDLRRTHPVVRAVLRARLGPARGRSVGLPESGLRIHRQRAPIYFLGDVRAAISATEIRRAARHHQLLAGGVPPLVAEYIEKMGLYRSRR